MGWTRTQLALWGLWAAATVAVAVAFVAGSDTWSAAAFPCNCADSLTFRTAAELTVAGSSPYDSVLRQAHIAAVTLGGAAPPFDLPFAYPPWAVWLLAPVLLGGPMVGAMTMVGLGTAAVAWTWALWVREHTDGLSVAWLLLFTLSTPMRLNAFLGQTGALMAALAMGVLLTLGRRPVLAGVLLAWAQLKPQYGLFLVVLALVTQQWRTVTVALAVGAVQVAGATLWFGEEVWPAWLIELGAPNFTLPYMVSWVQPAQQLFSVETVEALRIPVFLAGLLLGGAMMYRLRADPSRAGALGLSVALVSSPNTHPYDLMMLFPVLTVLGTGRTRWLGLVALTLFASAPLLPRTIPSALLMSCVLVALLRVPRR